MGIILCRISIKVALGKVPLLERDLGRGLNLKCDIILAKNLDML
jgi:hypothetical protein